MSQARTEDAIDIPDHVNDRHGRVSMFLLGLVIALLVVLIVAVAG